MNEEKTLSMRETWHLAHRALAHAQMLRKSALPVALLRAAVLALAPFIPLYVSAWVLNALYAGMAARGVITGALAGAAVECAALTLQAVLQKMHQFNDECLRFSSYNAINDAFLVTDYERLEQPDYKQLRLDYTYMNGSFGNPIMKVVQNAADIAQQLLTALGALALALPVFWAGGSPAMTFLLAALVAASLPLTLLIHRKNSRILYKYTRENMMGNRYFGYVAGMAYNYKIGPEVRIFRTQGLLRSLGRSMNNDLYSRWGADVGKYDALAQLVSYAVHGAVYAFVALRALAGGFPAGSIVKYVGALVRLSSGLGELIGKVTLLRPFAHYLEIYFGILDAQPIKYAGSLITEKRDDADYEIEFHNVSFKYPGSDQYALRNLNLKLHIGQHMAVVGMNGSGKTTMIKLLCRLYDPTEGEITLNGFDIRKYDLRQYMDLFSVVFQDFKLFSFTAGENVAASTEFDRDRVVDCCEKAGYADINPGMVLYKDLDEKGVEISGGEAQKLALARALYRNAPFMVLDEPTAALDPVAEFEIYTRFHALMAGHTAIYISHRLSSCRFCDDIAVFHEGRLVQRGSHDDLLAEGGQYAALWQAQAQYYTA